MKFVAGLKALARVVVQWIKLAKQHCTVVISQMAIIFGAQMHSKTLHEKEAPLFALHVDKGQKTT